LTVRGSVETRRENSFVFDYGVRIDERQVRAVLRVGVITAVLAAMALVESQSSSGVLWRLVTFTYQANVLAAAYYAWTLISPRADNRVGLRGAVVLYVVVAGVVWNLYLVDHSMGYTGANVLLHVVVPVLAVADWLLVGHSQSLVRWWQPWAWLAYPAAYLALALLVLNHRGRRAPYYFLDPVSIGMAGLLTNVAILAAGLVVLGYLLSGAGRVAVKRGLIPVTNGTPGVNSEYGADRINSPGGTGGSVGCPRCAGNAYDDSDGAGGSRALAGP
jgi:hypothetical protein